MVRELANMQMGQLRTDGPVAYGSNADCLGLNPEDNRRSSRVLLQFIEYPSYAVAAQCDFRREF